ncbi:TRAP transporter large permease [Xanthobacteraceae bacterium Astr-EGSB]|uniref:TRAP transporter large permease n=1 Tax=Astrobacterium formosum TaxID=3069710 RepID=UPI0027B3355C|nr:TRAP transporter large permease [Xanthobacteraceae bacterium Astr-EGSB]
MGAYILISSILLMAIGVPVAFALGLAGVISLLLGSTIPMTVVPQRMLVNIDSFPLMAIPFFILAGEVMSKGGASQRLVNFAYALVGHFRAGLGMVAIVASTIFAGISGSAAADTAAIGALLIPAMIDKGYRKGWAAALQGCAGALGPIVPPSLVMIIYGSLTGISISELFLGGFGPGIVIALALMLVTYQESFRFDLPREEKASWTTRIAATKDAIWALVLPLIVIGGILGGIFTATEAGVVAAAYAVVIGMFVYKEITWRDLHRIFLDACANTAMIMLIVATASVCSWLLAAGRVPQSIVAHLTTLSANPHVIMLLIILFVLLVGCFIETVAAAIILIPILFPIGAQMGYDAVHFGVVVVIALVFAGVTPPVGVLLFITSSIAKSPYSETCRYLPKYLLAIFFVLFLSAYVPPVVTFIPNLFLK